MMEKSFFVIDQQVLPSRERLIPFALTDVMTESAGDNNQIILHFWQLKQTFIMGMKDAHLKDLQPGLQAIDAYDYTPVLRNSGGLGVIADTGVLNVSLILPSTPEKKISIEQGYEEMLTIVRTAFANIPKIDAGEISNSYCPGKFDLSVNGKKFAGIAQRRVKNGAAIMMYLSVNGSQDTRGRAVRDFYLSSLKENFGKNGYPPVRPESMANLDELAASPLTVEQVKTQLLQAVESHYKVSAKRSSADAFILNNHYTEKFQTRMSGMETRNLVLQEK